MRVKDAYFGAKRIVFARWGLLLWTPQEGDEPGALRIRVRHAVSGARHTVHSGAGGGALTVHAPSGAVFGAGSTGKGAFPVVGAVTVSVGAEAVLSNSVHSAE